MTMERNRIDDIGYFIAFCVEIYKNAHHLPGAEVSKIFGSSEKWSDGMVSA